MKIAFAGSGAINKVHARAARNLGLELSVIVNYKPESINRKACTMPNWHILSSAWKRIKVRHQVGPKGGPI